LLRPHAGYHNYDRFSANSITGPYETDGKSRWINAYQEGAMTAIICWVCLAAVLLGLAGVLGRRVSYVETVNGTDQLVSGRWLGILIDYRKRYSLAHFQVVVWSLVLLSLVGAVFLARLLARVPADQLLNFSVPQDLLVLAGISSGTGVLATAVKATKNTAAIQAAAGKTQFSQMFMVEEGSAADDVVDPTKFQNFIFTLVGVAAFVAMMATFLINANPTAPGAGLDALPGFGSGLLWLVGLSSGAYVSGKIPDRADKSTNPTGTLTATTGGEA
jgi:hypothetical protein